MRVIAGTAGGRRLAAPSGRDIRPTSDRVREAMFSSLGDRVVGARVLDLFAGSGALGIEALSRGALAAVFVEIHARAAAVTTANLERLGLAGGTVRHLAAEAFCDRPSGGPFDVVLCDPPYATPASHLYALLSRLRARGAVVAGAVVVVEGDRRRDEEMSAQAPAWLAPQRARTYGDTVVRYWRVEPDGPPPRVADGEDGST